MSKLKPIIQKQRYFLALSFLFLASSLSAQEFTATYRLTFDAAWSRTTHPFEFPSDARWSPVVGLTHNENASLFETGEIATQGIVNMSQTGSRDPLNDEIDVMIALGGGEFRVNAQTRVNPSPDTITTTFEVSSSHPYLSLVSMIAPSPDWFVALRNLNLFENGAWVESKIVQFSPYDSGSDSGISFASPNFDTQPREGIAPITDGPIFANGQNASLGVWRLERIDLGTTCSVSGGSLVGGPFEFCVDGTPDNIPVDAITVTDVEGANSQWVVTDDRGYILGLPPSFTAPDFDAAGVGVCFIYHLAYEDGLIGLEAGNNIADFQGCFSLSNGTYVNRKSCAPSVGAVYAMSNGEGQVDGNVQGPNAIVAYGQAEDGTLRLIGEYPTGGNGGDFDGGEGLDPLISAYAITKTIDNRFVLAVNAGSNTVTSLKVNDDFSLTEVDTESTEDIGPNSIAHIPSALPGVNGLVYVSNITRPEFLAAGEPGQQGSIIGYQLFDDGSLEPIANSTRDLLNRPSAVQFSPDGNFLVVASINAGAAALASGDQNEIVVYRVNTDGTLSTNPTAGATSTLRGNAEGRNLPSAIGFQIVDDNYVVVTEAREFQPNGAPPAFPALQDGSVSTWQIQSDGSLTPINLDVASGENNTGRTACWLDFSDEHTFFVSNAIEAGLASYSFNNGEIELLDQVAAQGIGATGNTTDPAAAFGTTQGWIDLWISDDGQYLYQCYGLTGQVGVFAIDGAELTLIQEIGGLPTNNVQGIVSVGQVRDVEPPVSAFVDLALDIQVADSDFEIFEEVDYTITVTNEGTLEATNIAVSVGLPAGMVFTNANPNTGIYSLFFEEWTIETLGVGQTASLELTLFTLVEEGDITNFVEITDLDQEDSDSTPANGTGSPVEDDEASVTITPGNNGGFGGEEGEADLSLSIETNADVFGQFEVVPYTIILTNNGPDAASNIEVTAGLPEGLVYTSHNTSLGDYSLFFETWKIETLASGESAVLTLELFTLIDQGPITMFTEVFAVGQFDPDSTPNNGDGNNANEDDEAVLVINVANSSTEVQARNNAILGDETPTIIMSRLYPSPALTELNLEFFNTQLTTDASITVYDLLGRNLIQQDVVLAEGFNEFRLNVADLADGNYFVNIMDENGTQTTKRFIKLNR